MEGNRLTVDETERDLGIYLLSDIKCSDQCLYAFNKVSKVMGMIKRTIKYKEARIMVSLVRPHLECCISLYYKKDKELLEKVQRRFTKMIINMEGISYKDRLTCLNSWSLEERRNRQDVIEIFQMSQGKSIMGLQNLFTLEKNNNGTRGYSLKSIKMRCT